MYAPFTANRSSSSGAHASQASVSPISVRRASSLPCTVVTSKSFQAGRYVLTTTVRNPSDVAIVPAMASMMAAVSVSARTSLVTSRRARRRAMAERSFGATAGWGRLPAGRNLDLRAQTCPPLGSSG